MENQDISEVLIQNFNPHILPFIIAASLPFLIVGLEVLRTFGGDASRVFKSRAFWLLAIINSGFSVTTYLIICSKIDQFRSWEMALMSGIGFPALFRSRFGIFQARKRAPSPSEDPFEVLALSLDKVYGDFQNFLLESVDTDLAKERSRIAWKLTDKIVNSNDLEKEIKILEAKILVIIHALRVGKDKKMCDFKELKDKFNEQNISEGVMSYIYFLMDLDQEAVIAEIQKTQETTTSITKKE